MTDSDHLPPTDVAPWAYVYRDNATRLIKLATVLVGRDEAGGLVTDTVQRAVHSASLTRTYVRPGTHHGCG